MPVGTAIGWGGGEDGRFPERRGSLTSLGGACGWGGGRTEEGSGSGSWVVEGGCCDGSEREQVCQYVFCITKCR